MKSATILIFLLVAVFAYEAYAAALPDEEDLGDQEKSVQSRPAPIGHAGAHGKNRKAARLSQAQNANGTASVPKGKKKKKGAKTGAVKQGNKQQQNKKMKNGRVGQKMSSKKLESNLNNKEEITNKRNQNQFKKTPADKLDRKLTRSDMSPPAPEEEPTDATEETEQDYGPAQSVPAPGNRLQKFPNFGGKPDKSAPFLGMAVAQPAALPDMMGGPQQKDMMNSMPKPAIGVRRMRPMIGMEPQIVMEGADFMAPPPPPIMTDQMENMPQMPVLLGGKLRPEDMGPSSDVMKSDDGMMRPAILIAGGPDGIGAPVYNKGTVMSSDGSSQGDSAVEVKPMTMEAQEGMAVGSDSASASDQVRSQVMPFNGGIMALPARVDE